MTWFSYWLSIFRPWRPRIVAFAEEESENFVATNSSVCHKIATCRNIRIWPYSKQNGNERFLLKLKGEVLLLSFPETFPSLCLQNLWSEETDSLRGRPFHQRRSEVFLAHGSLFFQVFLDRQAYGKMLITEILLNHQPELELDRILKKIIRNMTNISFILFQETEAWKLKEVFTSTSPSIRRERAGSQCQESTSTR